MSWGGLLNVGGRFLHASRFRNRGGQDRAHVHRLLMECESIVCQRRSVFFWSGLAGSNPVHFLGKFVGELSVQRQYAGEGCFVFGEFHERPVERSDRLVGSLE